MNDEAVQRAIGSLEMCKAMMLLDPQTGETHALEDENQDNQDLYHACNLAQVALRQMRAEPCEWCDITGDWIYEVSVIRNRRKTHKGEMKKICPNCGRKLVK